MSKWFGGCQQAGSLLVPAVISLFFHYLGFCTCQNGLGGCSTQAFPASRLTFSLPCKQRFLGRPMFRWATKLLNIGRPRNLCLQGLGSYAPKPPFSSSEQARRRGNWRQTQSREHFRRLARLTSCSRSVD